MGTYVELKDTLTETILHGLERGLYGMLIHLGSLRSIYRRRIDTEDLVQSMTLTTRFPLTFFSRLPKVYNFCGSTKFLAWNGNDHQDNLLLEQMHEAEYEIQTISKVGGNVITGCGTYPIQSSGKKACITTLNHLRFKLGDRLLIENGYEKNCIATTLRDLHDIYTGCYNSTKMHLGCCLNLSHFQKTGYKLTTPASLLVLLEEYTSLFQPMPPGIILVEEPLDEDVENALLAFCREESVPIVFTF